jgi:uncharacterized protein
MILDYSLGAIVVMAFISYISAALSAATGMGGGVIFLIGLNFYLPLDKVIPIHGLIQLKNNFLRIINIRDHLIRPICVAYTIGCAIGVALVMLIITSLESKLIPYTLILILVIYSLFKPKRLPDLKLNNLGFFILGIATGLLGILIGAVDPLLAPFFLRDDFNRYQVIANKSYFQFLIHLVKVPVFIYLGFSFFQYWFLILVLFATGMLGTYHGIKFLDRIDQAFFIKISKVILFAVGLKVAYNIFEIL